MRICLYTDTALPKLGGQEQVVDALARQFLALGHAPVVFAQNPRRHFRTDDAALPYPVVRHPRFFSTRYFVSWYRWCLLRLRRRWPFDVLHCHGVYPPGYLAALTRASLGVPVLITSHGGDVYERNVRLAKPALLDRAKQALAGADCLVAISRFTRDSFLRLCPNPKRIEEIPNGVDLAAFQRAAPRPADLDPAIIPGQYLVFVGRLKERKGVDVLLQALRLVPANGQVQLVIVGEGEERAGLEALCASLGLSQRVRFVGPRVGVDKVYLLQNALAGVVPSRTWEAFGLVVLECYAAGIPVVASNMPGLADLIKEEETGWLVPSGAPDRLAGILSRILSGPDKVRAMASSVRRHAESFDWRYIAERHLELYQQLAVGQPFQADERENPVSLERPTYAGMDS